MRFKDEERKGLNARRKGELLEIENTCAPTSKGEPQGIEERLSSRPNGTDRHTIPASPRRPFIRRER
jgi:hypothetical protein